MFKQSVIETSTINNNIKNLLSEFLSEDEMKTMDIGADLSKTQKIAFEKFKKGESLLILGSAGVGKSKFLKTIQEYNTENNNKNMYITATTGVASYNISGMTIYSFMGFGTGDQPINTLIKRMLRSKSNIEKLVNTNILVIDEISMLSASVFEKINIICQHFKKNKTFMGGIQVIFTGDMLQNEAIFNQNDKLNTEPEDKRLIIESEVFNNYFNKKNKNIITLKENFRQKNDNFFMNLLLRVREGKHTKDDITLLENKCKNFTTEYESLSKKGIIPVHLVTSNNKAQVINDLNMKKLSTPDVSYNSSFTCVGNDKEIQTLLKKDLESQFKQKGLILLKLKKGARVMLIKNLDVSIGLVNGSIGTVSNFTSNKDPIVTFDNGQQKVIEKVKWELETQGNTVKVQQIPLILSYSLTLHKIQSLTLDVAIMDLSDCFCNHLVYSALSRVKNLDGLLLKSFNDLDFMVLYLIRFCFGFFCIYRGILIKYLLFFVKIVQSDVINGTLDTQCKIPNLLKYILF